MVVRPESPINAPRSDDDWFKEYMWMNEQENFEEEYLDSLHLEEVYNRRNIDLKLCRISYENSNQESNKMANKDDEAGKWAKRLTRQA